MCLSSRATSVLLAISIVGCASSPQADKQDIFSTSGTTLVETGYIVDVRDVTVHDNRSAPYSPVIGALLGGVAGSMIGSGTGRAIATAGGAVGGSIAAQEVSKPGSAHLTKVTVRLDDGRQSTYEAAAEDAFRAGERVQVVSHYGQPKIVRITAGSR